MELWKVLFVGAEVLRENDDQRVFSWRKDDFVDPRFECFYGSKTCRPSWSQHSCTYDVGLELQASQRPRSFGDVKMLSPLARIK